MKKIEITETTKQITGGNASPQGDPRFGGTWTEKELLNMCDSVDLRSCNPGVYV